jgi:hypothetical protein
MISALHKLSQKPFNFKKMYHLFYNRQDIPRENGLPITWNFWLPFQKIYKKHKMYFHWTKKIVSAH